MQKGFGNKLSFLKSIL